MKGNWNQGHLKCWRGLKDRKRLQVFKTLFLGFLCAAAVYAEDGLHTDGQTWTIEAVMPEHPAPAESYLCKRVDLPSESSLKLTGIEPLSQEALVHHMLLFGEKI